MLNFIKNIFRKNNNVTDDNQVNEFNFNGVC